MFSILSPNTLLKRGAYSFLSFWVLFPSISLLPWPQHFPLKLWYLLASKGLCLCLTQYCIFSAHSRTGHHVWPIRNLIANIYKINNWRCNTVLLHHCCPKVVMLEVLIFPFRISRSEERCQAPVISSRRTISCMSGMKILVLPVLDLV